MSTINQVMPPAAEKMSAKAPDRRALPLRDLFLLPALSLLTVLALLGGAEIGTRLVWPLHYEDACLVADPIHGVHYRPNCRSTVKAPETNWVSSSYNDCGYRTRESCRPKAPGTIRVAVLGSSFSFGFRNSYEQAYTTISGATLSRQCRRPVEFQNLGVQEYTILDAYRRMDEALALKPDLILLGVTPIDIRKYIDPVAIEQRNNPSSLKAAEKTESTTGALRKHVIGPINRSRALYMLQHFFYKDPQSYLNLYLLSADNAGYLRTPFSPAWEQRFTTLDLLIGDMASKARSAAVPMVVLIGPQPANVALINTHARPGIDPYAFARRVTAIAARHGIPTIDPLPAMGNRSDPLSLFFIVDGHLQYAGQQILADVLDKKLPTTGLTAFVGCSQN